jgi:Fe-S-cluster containining protein
MDSLIQLHADIETRVASIQGQYPDWPCRLGCDACCKNLAAIPELSAPEWGLLREGLAALPAGKLEELAGQINALARDPLRPIQCPLLDTSLGACRVYAHRPLACRSYGFYVERGVGLYCKAIEARVDCGDFTEVIWGNQEALDSRSRAWGRRRKLTEWFGDWVAADFPGVPPESPLAPMV